MTPFGIGGFSYSFGFRRRRERRSESGVRHGHRPSCSIRPPPSTLYTFPRAAGFGSALPRTVRSRGFTDFDGIQPRVSDTAAQIASSPLRIPVSPPGQRDWDSTLRALLRRTSTAPVSTFATSGTTSKVPAPASSVDRNGSSGGASIPHCYALLAANGGGHCNPIRGCPRHGADLEHASQSIGIAYIHRFGRATLFHVM